jgi:hypothetical protein
MAITTLAEAMRALADGSAKLAAELGYSLDFTSESIELLECYLNEVHEFLLTPESTWTENMKWSAALTHGAYVGEVIRRNCGGGWQEGTKDNPVFEVGQVEIRPAEKVMKRLVDGPDDNIGNYYRTILTCVAASEGKSERVVIM